MFDREATEQATQEAIDRVASGPSGPHMPTLREALDQVIHQQRTFTVDDVWAVIGETGMASIPERSVLGPVMREYARLGFIERTDDLQFLRSARPVTHGVPHRVWRSKVINP